MPVPLFVLGKQRSGTTWLANQLCEHSQIAGVQHDYHGGVHESAYFSHLYGRYGDLKRKNNYIEFVEAMAASDTMRILGISTRFLYSLWPSSYEQVFKAVMDRHADEQGARYWLDKTPEHTLIAPKLAKLYPDAKFIATIRNVHDVVNSTITRYHVTGRNKPVRILKVVLSWLRHKKVIERFAESSTRVAVIRYETLRAAPEQTYRELCDFLELEYEPTMLEQHYRPNTTFRDGLERGATLTASDHRLIDALLATGQALPLELLHVMSGDFRWRFLRRKLPNRFFSMHAQLLEQSPTREPVASSQVPAHSRRTRA